MHSRQTPFQVSEMFEAFLPTCVTIKRHIRHYVLTKDAIIWATQFSINQAESNLRRTDTMTPTKFIDD